MVVQAVGGLLALAAIALAVSTVPTAARQPTPERCAQDERVKGSGADENEADPALNDEDERVAADDEEVASSSWTEEETSRSEDARGHERSPSRDRPDCREHDAGGGRSEGGERSRPDGDSAEQEPEVDPAGDLPGSDEGGDSAESGARGGAPEIASTQDRPQRASKRSGSTVPGAEAGRPHPGGNDSGSGRSHRDRTTAQADDDDSPSLSQSRRSGGGQYEGEDPPEAGDDEPNSSEGSRSSSDHSGDLPNTGFAVGALALAGLALLAVGTVTRRGLPRRRD